MVQNAPFAVLDTSVVSILFRNAPDSKGTVGQSLFRHWKSYGSARTTTAGENAGGMNWKII